MLVTALHITVGEQVPKIFAIVKAEPVALRVARPLDLVQQRRCARSSRCSTRPPTGSCALLGVDPNAEFEEGGSPEELRVLIAQARAGGKLDPGEAGMLSGVFHLHEQEARQVMTPIPAVVTVDMSEDVETALRRCVSTGHTRLVVTEDENRDRVRGIVHANSLARRLMDRGPERLDRGARQGRPDRARDQAAGRPARRPAAPALVDGGRRSTSTAASPAS